jgi:hypothetical protein
MALSSDLAHEIGCYRGTGDGSESGSFVARIVVSALPNGGVAIDYEASSYEHGLQHAEHTLLVSGPDGRDRLVVAHAESPFLTDMIETAPGSGRFEQPEPFGPYAQAIVIEHPSPGELTYAWWWAEQDAVPTEQSKATVTRMS